jgi:hypothetical protein
MPTGYTITISTSPWGTSSGPGGALTLGHAAIQISTPTGTMFAGLGPGVGFGRGTGAIYSTGQLDAQYVPLGGNIAVGTAANPNYSNVYGHRRWNSYTIEVSEAEAVAAIARVQELQASPPRYSLPIYNVCSSFVEDIVFHGTGLSLTPDVTGSTTPGSLDTTLQSAATGSPGFFTDMSNYNDLRARGVSIDYLAPNSAIENTRLAPYRLETSTDVDGTTRFNYYNDNNALVASTIKNSDGSYIERTYYANGVLKSSETYNAQYGFESGIVWTIDGKELERFNVGGDGVAVERHLIPNTDTYDIAIELPGGGTRPSPRGPTTGPTTSSAPPTLITGAAIGSIFGSSIGQALGGSNAFARVAAGSMLSTALGTVGGAFDLYFNDTTGNLSLEGAVATALNSLGANLGSTLASQATSALSGYLVGEFYKMLGVNTSSTGGQLLTIASNTVVSQLISNIKHNVALSTGFNGTMIANMAGAIGGDVTMRAANDNRQSMEIAA